MDIKSARVVVILSLNRTDGVMELGRGRITTIGVNFVYVWDVYGANMVVISKDVYVHRTQAFMKNAQSDEIERILSDKSTYNDDEVIFINADGVLYPCFGMELRIAGGGREQWHIEATLRLAFGFTVEISAATVTIEQGRKDCTFKRYIVLKVLGDSSTGSSE